MHPFSSIVLPSGRGAVVVVTGELDIATAPQLASVLATCLAQHRVVDVDLGDVTFMGCAGINVLVAAQARAAALGGILGVVRPSAAVERIVGIAGVGWLLAPLAAADPAAV